jgi:hypothetical protein
MEKTAIKKRHERRPDDAHDQKLQPRRPIRAEPGKDKEKAHGEDGNNRA